MSLYEITRKAILRSKRNVFVRNYNSITRNYSFTDIERKMCKRKARKMIKKMDITPETLWDFITAMDLFYRNTIEPNCVNFIADIKYHVCVRRFSTEDKEFHIEFKCEGQKLEVQTTANKLVADFTTPTFSYHTVLDECKDKNIYLQIEDFIRFMIDKVYCVSITYAAYDYNVL